jgi:hypothetical protein
MHRKKPWEYGPLRVHGNGRYLVNGETPFFWMGDTAWLLFHIPDIEDTRIYLQNRRDKGFNVIQAVLVRETAKNALLDNDFSRPDKEGAFWRHIDAVLDMADDLGLYMGLLPCWGSMVKRGLLRPDNAAAYGEFLADRYGDRKNVIWILGGDIRGDQNGEVWPILAESIKKRAPAQLMGYHPFGRTSSSLWFDQAGWLDFNMFQSGHRRYDQKILQEWDDNAVKEEWFGEDNWRYVLRDHAASVCRPTLDGEPSYEQIPQGLHDPAQPYWQDHDVRRYAYWAVLEGACGHTYGHNAIMQFHREGAGPGSYGVNSTWKEALHHPGSGQMAHLVSLMNSVHFIQARAAQELVRENGEAYNRVSALMGEDFALLYSYCGEAFGLELGKTGWNSADSWWFDPAAGVYSYLGRCGCGGYTSFVPPRKPAGQNDWVLLLRRQV